MDRNAYQFDIAGIVSGKGNVQEDFADGLKVVVFLQGALNDIVDLYQRRLARFRNNVLFFEIHDNPVLQLVIAAKFFIATREYCRYKWQLRKVLCKLLP